MAIVKKLKKAAKSVGDKVLEEASAKSVSGTTSSQSSSSNATTRSVKATPAAKSISHKEVEVKNSTVKASKPAAKRVEATSGKTQTAEGWKRQMRKKQGK
jgi:hypothetical protein